MASEQVSTQVLLILAGLAISSGFQVSASWERITTDSVKTLPLGRVPAASIACGGRLYVFGGETDDNSGPVPNRFLNDLWTYTPGEGWALLSSGGGLPAPAPRVLSSIVCTGSELTIFGGVIRRSPTENVIIGDVWSFNLAQGVWRQRQRSGVDIFGLGRIVLARVFGRPQWLDQLGPGATSSHTATIVDSDPDSMIVIGGSDGKGIATGNMWVYSLSKNTWVKLKPGELHPVARSFHTSVAIAGTFKLKMWGGVDDRSVWTYDLRANTWSVVSSDLVYESGRSGAEFNGEFLSFGGLLINRSETLYSNTLSMQSADGGFREVKVESAAVPDGRCYAAFASIGAYMYMFGGFRRNGASGRLAEERLSDLWRLSLAPDPAAPLPMSGGHDWAVV